MDAYHREQVGRFYYVVAFTLVIPLAIGIVAKVPLLVVFAFFFAFVCWAFARLRIDVDAREGQPAVRWAMTFGWPSGSVPIAEITGAQTIAVAFWMGIGIHVTLRGWVWNVALGKAVQIQRRRGAPIVLGTDDPEGLLAAIARAR